MSEGLVPNPEIPCPPEILAEQTGLELPYFGFDGKEHTGLIEINKHVAKDVKAFFELAHKLHFPVKKVCPASDPTYKWDDERLMADNASSGFNYRTIAGTNNLSRHSQGLAFDVNPRQNPYIRYENGQEIVVPQGAKYDPHVPGTLSEGHILVKFMQDRGWEWGGSWPPESGRTDYHHFEFTPKND